MLSKTAAWAALFLAFVPQAFAYTEYSDPSGSKVPTTVLMILNGAGQAVPAGPSNPLDANGAAFQGVIPITQGTPVAAARSIGFVLTTPCQETFTLADGSTIALALTSSTSLQTLPFAVTNVAANGCVGSFWNLK